VLNGYNFGDDDLLVVLTLNPQGRLSDIFVSRHTFLSALIKIIILLFLLYTTIYLFRTNRFDYTQHAVIYYLCFSRVIMHNALEEYCIVHSDQTRGAALTTYTTPSGRSGGGIARRC